jgi:hypothetical protein
VVEARGAIEAGASPPFPGQPVEVAAEGTAVGGYGFVHGERGPFGLGARYDELWRRGERPADLRVFRTFTLDAQVEPTPRVRALLDYEVRRLAAPDGSQDARAVAAAMGDRLSLQLGVVF